MFRALAYVWQQLHQGPWHQLQGIHFDSLVDPLDCQVSLILSLLSCVLILPAMEAMADSHA